MSSSSLLKADLLPLENRPAIESHLAEAARAARRLAHDYGNILTSVLGYCELALSQVPEESSVSRFLKEALKNTQRGVVLTNRIRLFARAPDITGDVAILRDVTKEAIEALRAECQNEVKYQIVIENDLPPLAMHPDYLRQVLIELFGNAEEAGGSTREVSLRAGLVLLDEHDGHDYLGNPSEGNYLRIEIRDNGDGLSEEARRMLFQVPFFSDKPRQRGYGLSVVYGILKSHQGGFRVASRYNEGTVVEVLVPVVMDRASQAARQGSNERSVRDGTILVVDDDPTILSMVCFVLKGAGYQVIGESDPGEGWHRFLAESSDFFSLVVTDWSMPGLSGEGLSRRILDKNCHIPVLVMSGQVTSKELDRLFPDHPISLLPKPFAPQALLDAVASLERAPAS